MQMTSERGFRYAGPMAWNSLPMTLHELSTASSFECHLKAIFFTYAYRP